jgi:hypothetical protein
MPKEERARVWLAFARQLEASKNVPPEEIIRYYRLAEKIDPNLITT